MGLFEKIEKMAQDKKEWKTQMARVKRMPKEYQIVFKEIETYLWHSVDDQRTIEITDIYRLIDFFEEGAANGTPVLSYIGNDVGTFAQNFVRGLGSNEE